MNYYVNEATGMSIFDEDWNFIQRISRTNTDLQLDGMMFIIDGFIYIGGGIQKSIMRLSFDLNVVNVIRFNNNIPLKFEMAYDSCTNKIFGMHVDNTYKLTISIYNLYLRKLSDMNVTSINGNIKPLYAYIDTFVIHRNQIFISYLTDNNLGNILVTDINGQYIQTHFLLNYQSSKFWTYGIEKWITCMMFDQYENILFTSFGQLCLFSSTLNTTNCGILPFSVSNTFLYANMDESGRLVFIDQENKKIKFFY